jgi:hypothetical protein
MVQKQSEKNDVLSLSRLLENGSVPLKLVTETGSQKTGEVFLAEGSVLSEKNATVIFVCG